MSYKESTPLYSKIEVDSASQFAKKIDEKMYSEFSLGNACYKKKLFNKDSFSPSLQGHSFFDCTFENMFFHGIDAQGVTLRKCLLDECHISNSNFKSSDFSETQLTICGHANSFDFSDFTKAYLYGMNLEGCSLSESSFFLSTFSRCHFFHSEFIGSKFLQTRIENVDFARANLDYSEFVNVQFNHVIFPYWGILHVVKGLPEILVGKDVHFATADSDHVVHSRKYLDEITLLKPFFYDREDYLALANILVMEGETKKAYEIILRGLRLACEGGHFDSLRHLCRFASVNSFFSRSHLRDFYEQMELSLHNTKLSPMQYKNCWREIDLAKRLLIDCPYDQDEIEITIQTTISNKNYQKITAVLNIVDDVFKEIAPDTISHTEIRHNSPVVFSVLSSGDIWQLLAAFAVLDYLLAKSFSYIEHIQTIALNKKKLKKEKQDQAKVEVLQKQVAEMQKTIRKLEQQNANCSSTLILPGTAEFTNLSYKLSSKQPIIEELRAYSSIN